MERKTIYLCLAHMSEAGLEQKYVKEAFDTNWVVPMGPNVNAFEKDLKKFVCSQTSNEELGVRNVELEREVVCLSAGTAAVHLALIGCGVKAGDEVLVQSFTFCASFFYICIGIDYVCFYINKAFRNVYFIGSAHSINSNAMRNH